MNNNPAGPFDEIKNIFRKQPLLSTLILVNTGIWILFQTLKVILFLFNEPYELTANIWIVQYLSLPADFSSLADHPWTILTYMFIHHDFLHVLFNMLWLFWFGRIFLEFMKPGKLLLNYFAGGIAGGFFYMAAFNIFPHFQEDLARSVAIGASASVMAIVSATAFYVPNYSLQLIFIGRVKIIYLALILFIIDFFMIPEGNAGGHFAHIGGAIWGFCYVMVIKKGTLSQVFSGSSSFMLRMKRFFGGSNMYVSGNAGNVKRPRTDDEYNFDKKQKEKKTDEILDKISKGGYDSLTKEEKEFLFKSSRKSD
jgi:membrane associated rhomboid family serine protease